MKQLTLAVLFCLSAAGTYAADVPFDLEVLQFRAKTLAAKPYVQRPCYSWRRSAVHGALVEHGAGQGRRQFL
jgi:hypothetical protein